MSIKVLRHSPQLPVSMSASVLCSQPPLLSAMVRDVYSAQMSAAITAATEGRNSSKAGGNSGSSSTNATEFLAKALPLLVKEHVYWTTGNKAVVVTALDGSTHNMSRCEAELARGSRELLFESCLLVA